MGNPPPSIEWYRDGSPMDFEVGRHRLEEGRLVIESVLVSDGGRYTCIATNEVGNASVTTQLIVQGMSMKKAVSTFLSSLRCLLKASICHMNFKNELKIYVFLSLFFPPPLTVTIVG